MDSKAQKAKILQQIEAKYELTKPGRKPFSPGVEGGSSGDESIDETPSQREERRRLDQERLFDRHRMPP